MLTQHSMKHRQPDKRHMAKMFLSISIMVPTSDMPVILNIIREAETLKLHTNYKFFSKFQLALITVTGLFARAMPEQVVQCQKYRRVHFCPGHQ